MSKTRRYESPYAITGSIAQSGSEETPKDRYADSNMGTWKASNMDDLPQMKC